VQDSDSKPFHLTGNYRIMRFPYLVGPFQSGCGRIFIVSVSNCLSTLKVGGSNGLEARARTLQTFRSLKKMTRIEKAVKLVSDLYDFIGKFQRFPGRTLRKKQNPTGRPDGLRGNARYALLFLPLLIAGELQACQGYEYREWHEVRCSFSMP